MRLRDVSCATAIGLVVPGAVECGARSALLVVAAESGADVAQADGFETETETGAAREDAFDAEGNAERKDVVDARVIDASAENDVARGALPACELGKVMADVFGQVVYFSGGAPVLQGRYRITYVDGCMKYSGGQDWAVNAYGPASTAGSDRFWVVGGSPPSHVVVPPGTAGFLVGDGGYATFGECVAANLRLAPIDFDFPGGPIGIKLEDQPYADNVPGMTGRSPTWSLARVNECSP